MAKRRAPVIVRTSPFNWGTLVNVLGIPILTTIFLGGGFYLTTQKDLAEHTRLLAEEAIKRDALKDAEDTKREALRQALLDYASKTQEGIAKLSAHVEVQDEHIKNIDDSINRLVTGFQQWQQSVKPRSDLQRGG